NVRNLFPPTYDTLEERLATYSSDWNTLFDVSSAALAEAGFYSVGVSDCVKCFKCECVLSNWQIWDEAWREHAKWSPICEFVMAVKGLQFIVDTARHDRDVAGNSNALEYEIGIVLIPCGHQICTNCSSRARIKNCPICRQ
ncbi:unnamed protein product, partial [Medioppia subpectinata]